MDSQRAATKRATMDGKLEHCPRSVLQRVRTLARLPAVVETVGIEPTSAVAWKEASTSLVGALISSPGVRADGHVRETSPLDVPGAAGADRSGRARF